jgi:hypothetical protein
MGHFRGGAAPGVCSTCAPRIGGPLTCAPRSSARWPPENAQHGGPSHQTGPPVFRAPGGQRPVLAATGSAFGRAQLGDAALGQPGAVTRLTLV